jgi:hypothetical protein
VAGPSTENELSNNHFNKELIPQPRSFAQAELALVYFYLQEAGIEKYFELYPEGKVRTMKGIAKMYGVGWKNFEKKYNLFSLNREERISLANKVNIEKVIAHLVTYPAAQQLAIDDLKLIENL